MAERERYAKGKERSGGLPGLLKWASLFKNTRAIILFDCNRPVSSRALKWLKKKHRFRSVGISHKLLDAASGTSQEMAELLTDAPFVPLRHPFPQTETLVSLLGKGSTEHAMDSIVLSCAYSAPLLVSHWSILKGLEGIVTWQLKSNTELPEDELIRHLRIASYAIIDFYDSAGEAFQAVSECARLLLSSKRDLKSVKSSLKKIDDLCIRRAKRARQEGEKRFWRIESSPTGEMAAAYLDLLGLLRDRLPKMDTESLQLLSEEACGLAFPISAALCLPSSLD